MKLSIIIPCFNEQKYIREIIDRVLTVNLPEGIEREVVVVDDGSRDQTRIILQGLTDRVKVIFKEKNEGKGSALKAGFREATGDYITIQDADLEYNPADYRVMLRPILAKEAEIVFGSRNLNADNKASSQLFFYGGWFLTKIFNFLFGTKITDITTCYKLFPASLAEKLIFLPSNDFVFDGVELTYVLAKSGLRLVEVPITYQGRGKKEGKKIKISDGIKFVLAMLRIKLDLDDIIQNLRYGKALQLIKSNSFLLDIGCGQDCSLLYKVRNRIKFGYGLDKKLKNWESGNLKIIGFDFDSNLPLPIPPNLIDQATMLAVLEHVGYPQPTMKKVYQTLKKGGELILTTPTPAAKPVLEFLAFKMRLIDEDEIRDHKYYFSKQELLQLLKEAGFYEVEHHYFELGFNQIVVARK